jgi:hypothetical protein
VYIYGAERRAQSTELREMGLRHAQGAGQKEING